MSMRALDVDSSGEDERVVGHEEAGACVDVPERRRAGIVDFLPAARERLCLGTPAARRKALQGACEEHPDHRSREKERKPSRRAVCCRSHPAHYT
jgi:hypothetical protein